MYGGLTHPKIDDGNLYNLHKFLKMHGDGMVFITVPDDVDTAYISIM